MSAFNQTKGSLSALTIAGVAVLLLILTLGTILVLPSLGPSPPPVGHKLVGRRALVVPVPLAPSGGVGTLVITLHNTMSTPTGAYQQRVEINSSEFSNLINSNWTNGVPSYTANGTPVYGWIEGNATNTSTQTTLWLSLASIPANGWTNVSLVFGPKNSFDLSATGVMGEAPQLSSSYGKFDNGAKVFKLYDNFAGSSLASMWTVSGSWSYTVSNGFSVSTVPGSGGGIYTGASFSYPAVMDFYGDFYQSNPASAYIAEGFGTNVCILCGTGNSVAFVAQPNTANGGGPTPGSANGSGGTGNNSFYATQTSAVFTVEAISTSRAIFQANYSRPQWITSGIPSGPLPLGVAMSAYPAGSLTNTETTQWIRERAYEATMPSVTGLAEVFGVRFNETGLPAKAEWWVNISGGPSESSFGDNITFAEPNGTYAYTISTGALSYLSSPSSGSIKVQNAPVYESVAFSLSPGNYSLEFTESGLRSGTNWMVTVGTGSANSTASSIDFTRRNGTYAWSIAPIAGYTTSWDGNVTINGLGSGVAVAFTAVNYTLVFAESGLPTGTTWTITIASVTHSSSTGLVSFSEPNGTYAWSITPIPGFSTVWEGSSVVGGGTTAVSIAFTETEYPVTFVESGLPFGIPWTVSLGANSARSTTGQVQFSEPNGTYAWSFTPIPGYQTIWSGSVTINGGGRTVASVFVQLTYAIEFGETGLPTGTSWTVTLGSAVQSSPTDQVVFSEPNGTYSWSVTPIPGYSVSLPGSVGVEGASVNVSVVFSQVTYSVVLAETGLPSGTNWTVIVGSTQRSSTSPLVVVSEPNGTYSWAILPIAGYSTEWKGSLVVNGFDVSKPVAFSAVTYSVNFTESGLPKGASWVVALAGATQASAGDGISFSEPNGSYTWSISPIAGYTTTWTGVATVRDSGVPIAVVFTQYTYRLSFNETGLPSDVTWTVTVGNVTQSGTGTIDVSGIPNGSYAFVVGPVPGYSASIAAGSVQVNGGPTFRLIPFSAVTTAPTFLGLPQVEGFEVLGVIVAIAAIAVVAVILLRGRPPAMPPQPRTARTPTTDDPDASANAVDGELSPVES